MRLLGYSSSFSNHRPPNLDLSRSSAFARTPSAFRRWSAGSTGSLVSPVSPWKPHHVTLSPVTPDTPFAPITQISPGESPNDDVTVYCWASLEQINEETYKDKYVRTFKDNSYAPKGNLNKNIPARRTQSLRLPETSKRSAALPEGGWIARDTENGAYYGYPSVYRKSNANQVFKQIALLKFFFTTDKYATNSFS